MSKQTELLKRQLQHSKRELIGLRKIISESRRLESVGNQEKESKSNTENSTKHKGHSLPFSKDQFFSWVGGVSVGTACNNLSSDPRVLWVSVGLGVLWVAWIVRHRNRVWHIGASAICIILLLGTHKLVGVKMLEYVGVSKKLDEVISHVAISASSVSPMNQPVDDMSAIMGVEVQGQTMPDISNLTNWHAFPSAAAMMMLCSSNISAGWFGFLVADNYKVETHNDRGTRSYLMRFHVFEDSDIYLLDGVRPLAGRIQDVNLLRVDAWFLPHDAVVVQGSAAIVINHNVRKTFHFPPQKDLNPLNSTMGHGFIMVATNSAFDATQGL